MDLKPEPAGMASKSEYGISRCYHERREIRKRHSMLNPSCLFVCDRTLQYHLTTTGSFSVPNDSSHNRYQSTKKTAALQSFHHAESFKSPIPPTRVWLILKQRRISMLSQFEVLSAASVESRGLPTGLPTGRSIREHKVGGQIHARSEIYGSFVLQLLKKNKERKRILR